MFDSTLMQNLLQKLQPHPQAMSVYRVETRTLDTMELEAKNIAQRFAQIPTIGRNIRLNRLPTATQMLMPGGASLMLDHGSGAIVADRVRGTPIHPFENLPAHADLVRQSEAILRSIIPVSMEKDDDHLNFDRVVHIKAGCIVPRMETVPPFVTHVITTFRRYLDGVPVLGRASAFMKFAPGFSIEKFALQWRPVVRVPVDHPTILADANAAERVLSELSALMPGRMISLNDYTPEEFRVGYFSVPGKVDQAIMAPVFFATFRPRSPYEMGRVIIVPATAVVYAGFARVAGTPPRSVAKVVRTVPKPESETAHA